MPLLASDVMDEAAALMNDASKLTWGYTQLLPYLQRAHQTMELTLSLYGVRDLKEVSAVLSVPAGTTKFIPAGILPSDYIQPVKLFDRSAGSGDSWAEIVECDWIPEGVSADSIQYWAARETDIEVSPPNTNRECLLRYRKSLTPISDQNTPITILMSKSYLAAKTAANASAFGASNVERAAVLNNEAGEALSLLLSNEIKNQQGVKFRRKAYGTARRARRSY